MPAGALAPAHLRLGDTDRALGHVVDDAHTLGDAGADAGARGVHAVVVVDLAPVVVLDAELLRVGLAEPDGLAAPGERQHPVVVPEGGVDVPLPVGREAVEDLGSAVLQRLLEVPVRLWLGRGLVGRQVLAVRQVHLVVEVEVLPPGERAPRNQLLDVVRETGVRPAAVHDTGPHG